jgi:hypothetical protein
MITLIPAMSDLLGVVALAGAFIVIAVAFAETVRIVLGPVQ